MCINTVGVTVTGTQTCPHTFPYTGQEQRPKLDKREGTEEAWEEHQEGNAGSTGWERSRA